MIINYSNQSVLNGEKSIFLAGPTPRSLDVESYRKEAIRILCDLGFDGIVYVPELEFDNRTFNYDNQVWWERKALYNATVIVFWVPRSSKLPAFTTNIEFGYWIAKNSNKVIYGRPDNSERNRYLDWLYETETCNRPINNLEELLKEAIKLADKGKGKVDTDECDLKIITNVIKKYPEITELIGNVEFTPESFGVDDIKSTYGKLLFKEANPDQIKEFDRTALSILLYYYIKNNRYDKFVEQQTGYNKLSKPTFNEVRKFLLDNFDTPEKDDLLLYYVLINDLGKSQSMIDKVENLGIKTVDHDMILKYLIEFNMLPSLNKFSEESITSLKNVLNNGINMGQFIQGECVDYSFNNLKNLSTFEKILMSAEAMLDIGGVLGHIDNKKGSVVLNQSTAINFIIALKILSSCEDTKKIFEKFLVYKSNEMGLVNKDISIRKVITRICLMMRLSDQNEIHIVESEILENFKKYNDLIYELNQSGYENNKAILLYYSPAMLNNTVKYFKNNGSKNPIAEALRVCLPFMQRVIKNIRENMECKECGVITVMLRDAALAVCEDPSKLDLFDVIVLGEDEAEVKI